MSELVIVSSVEIISFGEDQHGKYVEVKIVGGLTTSPRKLRLGDVVESTMPRDFLAPKARKL